MRNLLIYILVIFVLIIFCFIYASQRSLSTAPSVNATLSPIEIHLGVGSNNVPSTTTAPYNTDGFTIYIPNGFVFDGSINHSPLYKYVSWHSNDLTQSVAVVWQSYSQNSYIAQTEQATISDHKGNSGVEISHPQITGASSSTMMTIMSSSHSPSAIYLWVTGDNGDIYQIDGIASTPSSYTLVQSIIASASFSAI